MNEPDDVTWLRTTHLSHDVQVPPFKSFVLVGNEDAPEKVRIYTKRSPLYKEPPVATFEADEEGTLVRTDKDMYADNPSVRDINRHVYSLDSALKFLNGKQERKLANNTVVRFDRESGQVDVVLHRTPVVTYYPSGLIQLKSGGYRSVTTKQRINQLLPPGWRLSQHKYEWTVTTPDGDYDFREGIVFRLDGTLFRDEPEVPGKHFTHGNPPSRTAELGTVSEGTLKADDLIDAFSDVILHTQGIRALSKLQREAKDNEYDEDAVLEMLTEAMDAIAPPYAFFGTLEGDGAHFGFWPSWDSIQEDVRNGELIRVDDTGDVPTGYSGWVLQVNERGNAVLFAASRGKLREVWSVV